MRQFIIFMLLCVLLTSCVTYTPELQDSVDTKFTSMFMEKIQRPASFMVQLRPADASKFVNGQRVPLRLHTLLEAKMREEGLLYTEGDGKHNYVLLVEKKPVPKTKASFSQAYSDAMTQFAQGEAKYTVEVNIEALMTNAQGEKIFGQRVAFFQIFSLESEETLANDITEKILEKIESQTL